MADYRDELYEEVDRRFNKMQGAKDHFSDEVLVVDPTPYERPGSGIIQPIGWVENSSPDIDGEASVKIDSDGITILNGALTLIDSFGSTVLTGAGFTQTWYDFIAHNVYNYAFQAGTTSDITAATIVNTASTVSDYEASLSSDLPYWVVEAETGAGTFGRVADTAAPGGFRLTWEDTEDATIFQDVPITPGNHYAVSILWKYDAGGLGDDFTRTISLNYRDKDHAAIGTAAEQGLTYNGTTLSVYQREEVMSTFGTEGLAPANARFLRVGVTFTRNAGNPRVDLAAVFVTDITTYGDHIWFDADGDEAMEFDASEGTMTIDKLRLTSSIDASLTSTGHALEIGPNVSGESILIDNNEIVARSGSSASEIRINQDGGNVRLGDSSSSILYDGTIVYGASGTAIDVGGGNVIYTERSDPAAPSANQVRIYARDNGSGKTQFVARFSSGAVQVLATQP